MPGTMFRRLRRRLFARVLRAAILEGDHISVNRMAAALRKAGLPLDVVVGPQGEPPVLLATISVTNGTVTTETLKVVIDAGFRVDAKSEDETGLRPIYVATQTQRSDVLEILLKAGADPNLPSNDGRLALLTACQIGNVTCTHLLLNAGADANSPTPRLQGTPLHLVAQSGHENSLMLSQLLVHYGCDVMRRNFFGKTALHSACESRRDVTTTIDFLLSNGGNVNSQDDRFQTPLMRAASFDNARTVKYLLQRGADKTMKDSDNRTALDIATEKHFKEVADVLSDHKS